MIRLSDIPLMRSVGITCDMGATIDSKDGSYRRFLTLLGSSLGLLLVCWLLLLRSLLVRSLVSRSCHIFSQATSLD
mgnify:CR=1 FL=1